MTPQQIVPFFGILWTLLLERSELSGVSCRIPGPLARVFLLVVADETVLLVRLFGCFSRQSDFYIYEDI